MVLQSLLQNLFSFLSNIGDQYGLFFLVLLTSLIDFIPAIILLFKEKYTIPVKQSCNDDYSIIIPIYKNLAYLPKADRFKRYRAKLTLCTTIYEEDSFMEGLRAFAKSNGFSVVQVDSEQTSLAIFKAALSKIETTYSIRIDADSYTDDDFGRLIGFIENKGWDTASVTVLPAPDQERTLAVKIQEHEYKNSMKYRYLFPFMVSGACVVGKTASLKKIMDNHSMMFYGEDLENGLLAQALDMKIGYAPFIVYTIVPEDMKGLFIQRRNSWVLGGFRHAVMNCWNNFGNLWLLFYDTILVYLMLPIRIYSLIVMPYIFLITICVSWLMTIIFNYREIDLYMLALPFWGTLQSTVMPFFSIYRYIKNGLKTHNWGIMKKVSWNAMVTVFIVLLIGIIFASSLTNVNAGAWQKAPVVVLPEEPVIIEPTVKPVVENQLVEYGTPISAFIKSENKKLKVNKSSLLIKSLDTARIGNFNLALASDTVYPNSIDSKTVMYTGLAMLENLGFGDTLKIQTDKGYLLSYKVKSNDLLSGEETVATRIEDSNCGSWMFILIRDGSKKYLVEAKLVKAEKIVEVTED